MKVSLRAYPRSFRRLLAIGFVLVGAPAAIGLVVLAFSVSSFAERAERAVYEARIVTQAARGLAEAVTALERNARQLLILEDRALLEAYEGNRRKFTESLRRLRSLAGDEGTDAALESAAAIEGEVFAALSAAAAAPAAPAASDQTAAPRASTADPARGKAAATGAGANAVIRRQVVERFEHLRDVSARIRRDSAERVDREVDSLRDTAVRVRRVALAQAVSLVPLVALMIVAFTLLVARPIRALDSAIRRLGSGNFSEPVRVNGPDDLVELGRRLDWMRNALIGLEQDRDRFMHEIAHSLKSSLAALREGTELLNDEALGSLNDEQREIVDILRRNALELQGLIVGLLQYGRARMERSALQLSTWDCRTLLAGITEKHALELRSKRISIEADLCPDRVRADFGKVAAILDNLVSNAIKYSSTDARIDVLARLAADRLVLEVADQGPGVAPGERDRIFEPFVQGRAVASGLVPGSGIGLSIAREHALAHGGSIELVDVAAGARFRVVIPVGVE